MQFGVSKSALLEIIKDINEKEYCRRIRKVLKASLNAGNTIQAINARAVSIIRYGAGIVK